MNERRGGPLPDQSFCRSDIPQANKIRVSITLRVNFRKILCIKMNNSTETQADVAIQPDRVLELFTLYYTPCLVFLGVLGNSLSVFVFFTTKLKKVSSSYYLAALAVSDTFFLVLLFVPWLSMVNMDVFDKPVVCEVVIYLSSVSSFLSVWLVLAFTGERFLAVGYPLHRQAICKISHTKRAKTVIVILLVLSLVMYTPLLIFAGTRDIPPRGLTCTLILEWQDEAKIFNIFDSIMTYAVPVVGVAVLNAFISRNMWVMAKVRKRLISQNSSERRRGSSPKNRKKLAPISQYKITKMLLVVSTTCLCMNLPSYIMRLLAGLIQSQVLEISDIALFITVQQYCLVLFNTNFGIDFVLYCISGQNFRKAVYAVFCPRRLKRKQTPLTVSDSRTQSTGSSGVSKKRRTPISTENNENVNCQIIAMKVL